MKAYLIKFKKDLDADWKGSLVKVNQVDRPNAKECLSKLAKEGAIERVAWGWYWVPAKIKDVWDFLRKDKNFKVVADQTAASLWNADFVHRDVFVVKVKDRSYAKALVKFGASRGWQIDAEYTNERLDFRIIDGLRIESMEQTIVDCLKRYAFMDAYATLYFNRKEIKISPLVQRHYWERMPHRNVRIGQLLAYGWAKLNGKHTREIDDWFIREDVDEAVEKVIDIG